MESYQTLTLYKISFDICVYFEKIVKKFDRYHKYAIGTDLKNMSRKITLQVIKTSLSRYKYNPINELVLLIEELKLLTRICQEIKAFPNKNSYGYISKQIVILSNQSMDWLKTYGTRYCENKQNIAPEL